MAPQPCPLGRDYLRSCYLSDMVLSAGGAPVHGGWYFTSARATTASNFGSLNWWKDNASAVFPGIGEVSRGPWRDGSPLPCIALGLCFTAVISFPHVVRARTPLSGGVVNCVGSLNDWNPPNVVVPGPPVRTLVVGSSCGGLPQRELMHIVSVFGAGPFPRHDYGACDIYDASTRTYTWHTSPGVVPGWPGGDVSFTLVS